jgi:hypothetical protein
MASTGENPLNGNERLQKLMACVDTLRTEKEFLKWRKSFLKVYTSHLDPDGVLNAKDANYRLLKNLKYLTKRVIKVQELIDNHNIHPGQVTAEGRRALTNLSDELSNAEKAINDFMPKTSADEDKVGYDKFELGAILVQDGFYGYDLMVQTRDTMEQITKLQLAGIADSNFLQIYQYYSTALDVFIQVMEDLGLFRIMRQCVEVVYKGKKRKELKPPEPLPDAENTNEENRKGIRTTTTNKSTRIKGKGKGAKDKYGGTFLQDNESSDSSKKKKEEKHSASIGRGGPNGGSRGTICDQDGDNPANEEKEEDEKDEEAGEGGESEFLYYFDPKTNSIGMIDRKLCGAKSKLLVDLEKEGKDAYENHVTDADERQHLIWLLKKLEKTKPKETSWLEEIKKEKAAKNGTPLEKKKSNEQRMPTGSKPAKRRTDASSSSSMNQKDISATSDGFQGPGFRDPFAGVSSSLSSKAGKKKTVENYQGKYKKAAAKPDTGGWKKMT